MDRIGEAFIGREALRGNPRPARFERLCRRRPDPCRRGKSGHALCGGDGGAHRLHGRAGPRRAGRLFHRRLLHTGRKLVLPLGAKLAFACAVAAVLLRVLPDMGLMPHPPGPPYAAASLLSAAAFLLWLGNYWRLLSDPKTLGVKGCG